MNAKIYSSFFCCLILLFFTAVLGCGKKGDPVPDYSVDTFAFESLSAHMMAEGTAVFRGKLSGSAQNMAALILEIQAVNEELCEGCPFLAQDSCRFEARDVWENESGTQFSFVYRPVFPGEFYRWRLVGHNVYSGISAVVSPIQVLSRDAFSPAR